jgi:hypothetical protein
MKVLMVRATAVVATRHTLAGSLIGQFAGAASENLVGRTWTMIGMAIIIYRPWKCTEVATAAKAYFRLTLTHIGIR